MELAASPTVPVRPNPHVAMGIGKHFCLGAHLGRLETRVFFSEFLARFPHIEPAAEPERVRTTHINGLRALPLVVR